MARIQGQDGERVENELCKDFSLASLKVKPFEKHFKNPIVAIVATIFAYGRQLEVGNIDKSYRRVCAIGEIIAPSLDPTLSLQKEKAGNKVCQVVRTLLSSDNVSKVTKISSNKWQKACHKGMLYKYVAKDYTTGEGLSCWPGFIPIGRDAFIDENGIDYLTPNRAMAILLWMAYHAFSILKYEILQLLLLMHVGLINEGVAPVKMVNNLKYLEKTFNIRVTLRKNLLNMLYKSYGNQTSDKLAKKICFFWISWIDPLIIKVLSPKAENNHLTINTIREAINMHPDFPWENLTKHEIYHKEILNLKKIISLVASNPYIVFNKNFKMAEEKNYCNIASIARDLVCHEHEKLELKNSPCFVYDIPFKDEVETLKDNYFEGKAKHATAGIPANILKAIKDIKANILNVKDEEVDFMEMTDKERMKSFFESKDEVRSSDYYPLVTVMEGGSYDYLK